MDTGGIETSAIVAAFAAHAGLELTENERGRLEEYAETVWDMARRLRAVDNPGLEGLRDSMPLRAAYANRAGEAPEWQAAAVADARPGDPERGAQALLSGVVEAAAAIRAGSVTPADLTAAALERLARYDPFVRSTITVDSVGARAAAAALTAELATSGPRSLLHGIVIGAKDSIPVAGMRCTYNSPLMRDWVPRRDAEPMRRLRAAGAVLIGKHNLNEFGWSLPSEQDLAPPPRNPWYPQEFSVGSTSGGGAAVAAGLASAAIGTDGGGSIRLPAAQHRLFGIKPGHDAVPRRGVGEGSVSEVSVLARSAEDAAAVLAAMLVDPDAPDAAGRFREEPAARVAQVRGGAAGVRLGVPRGYIAEVDVEDDVARAFAAACLAAEKVGIELVDLPDAALAVLPDAVRANFVIIAAEHYFDHEGPSVRRDRYGASAAFYNLPGSCLSAADYLHAVRVGGIARAAVDAVLEDVDLIFTPTTPVTRTSTARDPRSHRRGGNARFTSPFNLTGHPASSFPAGLSGEGIPVGVQLVGRRGSEFDQLRVARAVAARLPLPPFPDMEAVIGGAK